MLAILLLAATCAQAISEPFLIAGLSTAVVSGVTLVSDRKTMQAKRAFEGTLDPVKKAKFEFHAESRVNLTQVCAIASILYAGVVCVKSDYPGIVAPLAMSALVAAVGVGFHLRDRKIFADAKNAINLVSAESNSASRLLAEHEQV